jgi:hypothetical protein
MNGRTERMIPRVDDDVKRWHNIADLLADLASDGNYARDGASAVE